MYIFWSCNNRFYSTRKKQNHLPLSWRPVLDIMPEQQQASWCGLSFPLSWSCFSSTVCHSVGKTSVKGTGGSVHLSLLVGHDFYFDLSEGQPLDCLEGSSATGSLCQPQGFEQHLFGKRHILHTSIEWNNSRWRVFLLHRLSQNMLQCGSSDVQCRDNLSFHANQLLVLTQQQSKDLNGLHDKTDPVQHKWIVN